MELWLDVWKVVLSYRVATYVYKRPCFERVYIQAVASISRPSPSFPCQGVKGHGSDWPREEREGLEIKAIQLQAALKLWPECVPPFHAVGISSWSLWFQPTPIFCREWVRCMTRRETGDRHTSTTMRWAHDEIITFFAVISPPLHLSSTLLSWFHLPSFPPSLPPFPFLTWILPLSPSLHCSLIHSYTLATHTFIHSLTSLPPSLPPILLSHFPSSLCPPLCTAHSYT